MAELGGHGKWHKPDTQKNKYYMIPFYEVPKIGKIIEIRSRLEVSKGVAAEWLQSSCLGWWKSLEADSGDGCATMWM